jgi:hypothetical protein
MKEYGVTAASPVYSKNGTFIGALGTDIYLYFISTYLSVFKIIFIFTIE